MSRPGARTGPRPRFDLAAAVRVATELGVNTFTLAQVAARLGISSPALYRVVASRDALADECMKRWVDSLPLPSSQLSWQEQLRTLAEVLWNAYESQPEMGPYIMAHPEAVRHIYPRLAQVSSNLAAGGLTGGPERIAFAVDFVADTVQGAHLGAQSMHSGTSVPDASNTGDAEPVPKNVRPTGEGRAVIAEYMDAVQAEPATQWTFWSWTRRKVEFIIAGLDAGF